MKNKKLFTQILLSWNSKENKRQMPWKGEKDPYKIWISEIILQQTRVEQGLGYYHRFIKSFPDVITLAKADEQKVFKHWEGLGYYSRCRNLIASAKFISSQLGGDFPKTYASILSLKGVGTYTASAIASFAYNLPYAVIDGNVFRVLSRFFGIEIPIDTTDGKKSYANLANELLDKTNPGTYNQAIMDFGATVCKPALPLCDTCPLYNKCLAFKSKKINTLPVKQKAIKRRNRFLTYVIAEYNKSFYVRRRENSDIWRGLYEFILFENHLASNEKEFVRSKQFDELFGTNKLEIAQISKQYLQKLTHQTIHGSFVHIRLSKALQKNSGYHLVSREQLDLLPFPKFINSYLQD